MKKLDKGFSLVEIIVASAVMVLVVLAVINVFSAYIKASKNNINSVKAAYLAEEGIEAVKMMRDNGWNTNIASVATGTAFRIGWTGGTWSSTSSTELVGGEYDRTIVLSDAYRDAGTQRFAPSGTLDTNAKKITVNVSWNNNGTTTKVLETYMTNLFEN